MLNIKIINYAFDKRINFKVVILKLSYKNCSFLHNLYITNHMCESCIKGSGNSASSNINNNNNNVIHISN